jgi:hypothetical protein
VRGVRPRDRCASEREYEVTPANDGHLTAPHQVHAEWNKSTIARHGTTVSGAIDPEAVGPLSAKIAGPRKGCVSQRPPNPDGCAIYEAAAKTTLRRHGW